MHHNCRKSIVSGHGDGFSRSAFEHTPARRRNHDANDLDRLPISPNNCLELCRYKSGTDKGGQHCACEAMGEYERLGKTERIAGEQL